MAVDPNQPPAPPAAEPAAPANPNRVPVDGLWAERQEDQGRWVIGVTFGGADHVIASRKLGGIDDDIREAAEPGFKAARWQAYLQEVAGVRG